MLGDGSFGHAGAGGRMGFAHPESGVAVGYVCNNMLWDGIRGPDDALGAVDQGAAGGDGDERRG